LTPLNMTVIVDETLDTRDLLIMPNPKGHEDSIKDSRFKAAWQSGPTRTIRVPIALADATLEYARQLDQGIEPHDTGETWDNGTQAVLTLADFFEPRDTRIKSHGSTPQNGIATTESRDTMLKKEVEATELHLQYLRESLEGLQGGMLKKSGLNDAPELTKLKAGVTNIQLLIELSKLQTELEAYKKQQPASEFELPEAPELLNRLKAKRKKATASLADIEAILEILEELTPLGEN
jgi:hypothetical protein